MNVPNFSWMIENVPSPVQSLPLDYYPSLQTPMIVDTRDQDANYYNVIDDDSRSCSPFQPLSWMEDALAHINDPPTTVEAPIEALKEPAGQKVPTPKEPVKLSPPKEKPGQTIEEKIARLCINPPKEKAPIEAARLSIKEKPSKARLSIKEKPSKARLSIKEKPSKDGLSIKEKPSKDGLSIKEKATLSIKEKSRLRPQKEKIPHKSNDKPTKLRLFPERSGERNISKYFSSSTLIIENDKTNINWGKFLIPRKPIKKNEDDVLLYLYVDSDELREFNKKYLS